jgi:Hypervirulence associated proteins TUDOR domain
MARRLVAGLEIGFHRDVGQEYRCRLDWPPGLQPEPRVAVDRKLQRRSGLMTKSFKVGDHVSWNSEAGRVRGRVVRVHARDVNYKGYIHHASRDDPQYEIKSDKTDHIALHKGKALRLLSR